MIFNRKTNISVKNDYDNTIMLSSVAQPNINSLPISTYIHDVRENSEFCCCTRAFSCACKLRNEFFAWHCVYTIQSIYIHVCMYVIRSSFFSRTLTFTYCNADRTLTVPLHSFVIWHSFTQKTVCIVRLVVSHICR